MYDPKVVCDNLFLIIFNEQVYSGELKFFPLAYNEATNKPYGFILLDLCLKTSEELRVVMDILTINYHLSTREQ